MIDAIAFHDYLKRIGIGFFTGVPDSLLASFCACLTDHCSTAEHIIAANEGNAIALASGYHLATGKVPLVYMQNSGLGNAVNPLLSLADKEVYSIPMLVMIGWRGEPGTRDEPQHIKQGRIQHDLLSAMEIPCYILDKTTENHESIVNQAYSMAQAASSPVAIVVKKGTFAQYSKVRANEALPDLQLSREEALAEVLGLLPDKTLVISTTGKLSREVFEYRVAQRTGHGQDFLTVGSMGHASQIALGIALNTNRPVVCLDGDGAALMHLGGMAVTAMHAPGNYYHILFNNGSHESVGGQPTVAFQIDLPAIAKGAGYRHAYTTMRSSGIRTLVPRLIQDTGPAFLEIMVANNSRDNLGRPTTSPRENKNALMRSIQDEK